MTARKRKLLIEVAAGDTECGKCWWLCTAPIGEDDDGYGSLCALFGDGDALEENDADAAMRLPECLAAEQPEPEPKWAPVRDEAGKVVSGQHRHPVFGLVRYDDQKWYFDPPGGGDAQGPFPSAKRAKLRAKTHAEGGGDAV